MTEGSRPSPKSAMKVVMNRLTRDGRDVTEDAGEYCSTIVCVVVDC